MVAATNSQNDYCGHRICTDTQCFRKAVEIGFSFRNHAGEPHESYDGASGIEPWLISKAFHTVVYSPSILTRYYHFPRLIHRVCVPATADALGFVQYKAFEYYLYPHNTEISMQNDQFTTRTWRRTYLDALPVSVLDRIFQFLFRLPATPSPHSEVQINASQKTRALQPHLDVNVTRVSRVLSDWATRQFYRSVRFVFRGDSSTARATLPDANLLINFISSRFTVQAESVHIYIDYRIELSAQRLLVNIRPLVLLIVRRLQSKKLCSSDAFPLFITSNLHLPLSREPKTKKMRLDWSVCRAEAQVSLLYKLYLNHATDIPKARAKSSRLRKQLDGPCPDIWASFNDRHVKVVELTTYQPTENDGGFGFVSWCEVIEALD